MSNAKSWIEVDRTGLAQVIADRPTSFLAYELIQNALDERGVSKIKVSFKWESRGRHRLTVSDDAPDGYHDIRHAWTLYAPSKKKADPTLRGRFNSGCKMVLALALDAKVVSTKAAVAFDAERGRRTLRERTQVGTYFSGLFRLTHHEVDEITLAMSRLLLPDGVELVVTRDDDPVGTYTSRKPLRSFEAALPTVVADDEGVLRRSSRKARVDVHRCPASEQPTLHEMGIPVVELGEGMPYHVDVQQRVPLNQDRDNVTPAYARKLHVAVLNETSEELDEEEATAAWVTEAISHPDATPRAVGDVVTKRYGEERVAYDPSDPEANKLAMSQGYTVVHGASLPRKAWDNVRRDEVMLPAGKVTPSPKVASSIDGVPPLDDHELAIVWREAREWALKLWPLIDSGSLRVDVYEDDGLPFKACFGNRTLGLNVASMRGEFDAWHEDNYAPMLALLIHEFAHHWSGDHLSAEYHRALCRIGATFALAPAPQPEV